jgi:hypothetical protein
MDYQAVIDLHAIALSTLPQAEPKKSVISRIIRRK